MFFDYDYRFAEYEYDLVNAAVQQLNDSTVNIRAW